MNELFYNPKILAVAMFIAIGLGLFELIREVTEPDKTAIGKGLPENSPT